MKNSLMLFCLALPFSAIADIAPPPANYSIAVDDTVIDASGQVNDDPEQVVTLTATEIPIVRSDVQQVETKIMQNWTTRGNDATLTGQ